MQAFENALRLELCQGSLDHALFKTLADGRAQLDQVTEHMVFAKNEVPFIPHPFLILTGGDCDYHTGMSHPRETAMTCFLQQTVNDVYGTMQVYLGSLFSRRWYFPLIPRIRKTLGKKHWHMPEAVSNHQSLICESALAQHAAAFGLSCNM
jgi:hypothetical protein